MVTPREAATVMLVRDDPDLQVFMLRRNLNADWVGGAYVFPGGAVDDGDRAHAVLARCPDRSDADASARLGVATGGLGYWVAGVRETFEEAGVLLARSVATGALVDPSSTVLETRREALNLGALTFAAVLEAEDLVLDVGAMHVLLPLDHARGEPPALRHAVLRRRRTRRSRVPARRRRDGRVHLDPPRRRARGRRPGRARPHLPDPQEPRVARPVHALARAARRGRELGSAAVRRASSAAARVALPGDPDDTVGAA